MKQTRSVLSLVLIVLAIAGVWYGISRALVTEEAENPESAPLERYASGEWLFSFEYPPTYNLTERDLSTPQRGRLSLTLIDKAYVAPEAGEGPMAITVDVFQNAENERYTAKAWIEGNSASNYKLGPGTLTERTVAGHEGLEYGWSGLYEGKSVVIATADFVYVFSVTRNAPTDAILADFEKVLSTARVGSF